ncbi:IS3-like element ISStma9 family transposase [Stenotrophomonas maltophilia]|uniref:IS3-like element ISStma9 family transposase n=1 Tax=Stenotrophomonas maltophilia TaxID=40324 RepID=UPI000BA37D45|nr:IS3-like element ISStma9 family transposase [Stenotrophomonas maltophilia]QQA83930.1 IS3-like element ISStma9 family transposase [Stenotrophomonas maltophilia]WQE25139.1 IS3-like element ISStma9 family transposase [Stenotrophomonas maltophilia]HDS1016599.1 IS3-like element ISStma9 family transposase [Stenotrophomonas maltophilia]
MSTKRYTDEFKIEAVRQIVEYGRPVAEVAERLGVSIHSLYGWKRQQGKGDVGRRVEQDQNAEVRRLKAELRRVTEERDIPKKSRRVLCKGVRAKYAFMKQHADEFGLAAMCRMLGVHRSGYYAWLKEPASARDKDDQRLLGLIKHSWLESGSVYGHRKVTTDLRELGETCSRHRVARLMKSEGLRAMVGYGRRPRPLSGPVGSVAKNVLARGFKVSEPNRAWVTDITYIRTYDGFLYLAVVLDLFSRQVVGWATRPTQHTDLVLQALLAAVWRRKPSPGLLLHSDQGTQFTSEHWQSFLREHDIVCSMSRRGNCHDNAAMESFFQLLKRERIKRRIYSNHDEARADVFQYIEMFYNPKRRHSSNDGLSPVEFEKQYALNG